MDQWLLSHCDLYYPRFIKSRAHLIAATWTESRRHLEWTPHKVIKIRTHQCHTLSKPFSRSFEYLLHAFSLSVSLSSKPIHTIHTYIPRIEISVSLVAALSSFPLCLPSPDLISFQTQNPNPNSLSLSLYGFSDLYSILNIMSFCACI